jgi:hypothetical protein
MKFTRHLDRLAAALAWLAGLLPRATVAPWRPAAEVLHPCTTVALPARLQRTTARLRRWAYGPKTDWP